MSLIIRSQAAVTTGASAMRRKSSARREHERVEVADGDDPRLLEHDERVLLRAVELDRELTLGVGERFPCGAMHLRQAAVAQRVLKISGGPLVPEVAALEEAAEALDRRLQTEVRVLAPDRGVEDGQVRPEGLEIERAGSVERVEQAAVVVDREGGQRGRERVVVDERDRVLRSQREIAEDAVAPAAPSGRGRPSRPSRASLRADERRCSGPRRADRRSRAACRRCRGRSRSRAAGSSPARPPRAPPSLGRPAGPGSSSRLCSSCCSRGTGGACAPRPRWSSRTPACRPPDAPPRRCALPASAPPRRRGARRARRSRATLTTSSSVRSLPVKTTVMRLVIMAGSVLCTQYSGELDALH